MRVSWRSVGVLCVVVTGGCDVAGVAASPGGGSQPQVVSDTLIAEVPGTCSGAPAVAVHGDGAAHAALITTYPYSGHVAARSSAGSWAVVDGALGEAYALSVASLGDEPLWLVEPPSACAELRDASGSALPELGDCYSAAEARSLAVAGGELHALLRSNVDEDGVYRRRISYYSGPADGVAPVELVTADYASAIDVSVDPTRDAPVFLWSVSTSLWLWAPPADPELVPDTDTGGAWARGLAHSADGTRHVLIDDGDFDIRVVSQRADGGWFTSLTEIADPYPEASCPSTGAEGDTCPVHRSWLSGVVLVEGPGGAWLVGQRNRRDGLAAWSCELPTAAPPPHDSTCGWDDLTDVVKTVELVELGADAAAPTEVDYEPAPEGWPSLAGTVSADGQLRLVSAAPAGYIACELREMVIRP